MEKFIERMSKSPTLKVKRLALEIEKWEFIVLARPHIRAKSTVDQPYIRILSWWCPVPSHSIDDFLAYCSCKHH
jgi:hypothetical protein